MGKTFLITGFILYSVFSFAESNEGDALNIQLAPKLESSIQDMDLSFLLKKDIPRYQTGIFLAEKVTNKIHDSLHETNEYANGPTTEFKNKSYYLISMNIGDEGVTNALIEAKNSGVKKVSIIVDGDSGLELKTQNEDKANLIVRGWEQVDFKSGAMGRELLKLKEAGFTINDINSPYNIFMQPLVDGDHLRPLQHEKGLVIVFDKVKQPENANKKSPFMHQSQLDQDMRVEIYRLTDNFTDRGESVNEKGEQEFLSAYNRGFEIVQREIALFELEHLQAFEKTLAEGKSIYYTPGDEPFLVNYKDGSSIEVAYTNGRNNPNDRILPWLDLAKENRQGSKLKEIVASHFAFSHDNVALSMVDLWNSQVDVNEKDQVKLFLVADSSFIDPFRYGLPALFSGYTVKIGDKYNNGILKKARESVSAYSYIKVKNSLLKSFRELKGNMLWHDKTTILVFEDWTLIFTGSFNLSDRSPNAEYQYMIKVPTGSELAEAFIASIKNPVKERPDLFMDLDEAVFRTRLSQFLGIAVGEMSIQNVRKFMSLIKNSKFDKLKVLGLEVRKDTKPSALKIDENEYLFRLEKLTLILKWYKEEIVSKNKSRYQRFTSALLNFIIDKPTVTHQQLALFSAIIEKPPTKASSISGFVDSLIGYSDLPKHKEFKEMVVNSFKEQLTLLQKPTSICVGVFMVKAAQ